MVVWWSVAAFAGEVEGTASGFAELRGLWYAGVDGTPWVMVERFRPTFEAELSKHVHLESTVELGLQQGRVLQDEFNQVLRDSPLMQPVNEEDAATPFSIGGCTLVEDDSANRLFRVDGVDDYLSVERLFADVYLGKADLRFGRQSVQWGNALLVHPADPFPEVLFLEPWKPRTGVNAGRANLQLGDVSALTVLGGLDDSLRYARVAGRATTNVLETDLSLIGAWREETQSGIAGIDVKGTLELGFWFEGSWHFQPELNPTAGLTASDFSEIAVGLDYSFPVLDAFVIGAQYYRNGGGSPEPLPTALAGRFAGAISPPICTALDDSDAALAPTTAYDPFAPIFVGRDYGFLYALVTVDDRWSGNTALVQNLNDGSGVAVPTIGYRPAGWSEISLSAQIPYAMWGDGGELRPSEKDTTAVLTTAGIPVEIDFGGLVPDATVILWTRASF